MNSDYIESFGNGFALNMSIYRSKKGRPQGSRWERQKITNTYYQQNHKQKEVKFKRESVRVSWDIFSPQ